jgi:ABC-type bacteriocin/lantibiotic exporter with double-glycine peptidase domain
MIMIKDSKIVLLDESTGPFDHMTETIFQQTIDILKSSKTLIMIAQVHFHLWILKGLLVLK